jgi:RNA polymerase sigma-70 factor (ECF subfamily)
MDQSLDHDRVARAMAGDRVAMDALWRGHRSLAAAVLMAHLPRNADLQDLLQDVAMKMVSQIHSLKCPAAFRPWLRTVARNVAVSAGRGRRVRSCQTALPEVELADPRYAEDKAQEPVRERLDRLLEIVGSLHVDYREPLLMRCVQGLSQAAIAAALDLPVTTVETRLARARRLLRGEMTRPTEATPDSGVIRR